MIEIDYLNRFPQSPNLKLNKILIDLSTRQEHGRTLRMREEHGRTLRIIDLAKDDADGIRTRGPNPSYLFLIVDNVGVEWVLRRHVLRRFFVRVPSGDGDADGDGGLHGDGCCLRSGGGGLDRDGDGGLLAGGLGGDDGHRVLPSSPSPAVGVFLGRS